MTATTSTTSIISTIKQKMGFKQRVEDPSTQEMRRKGIVFPKRWREVLPEAKKINAEDASNRNRQRRWVEEKLLFIFKTMVGRKNPQKR